MAYCKHSYTVLRNGLVIVNGVTDAVAIAAITADNAKFCPPPPPPPTVCNVVISDIVFDGENWNIALTEDSEAPYLWLFGMTESEINLVSPTPDFPATLTTLELFNVADLAALIAAAPQSIDVAGTLTNTTPGPGVDPCSVGSMGFTVVTPASWESGDEFLLPTSLDSCEGGTLTYSVIYTDGVTSATVHTEDIAVISAEAGVVMMNVYCDGLIAQTYIYNLPRPTTP